MLTRLRAWLRSLFEPPTPDPHLDPIAQKVTRRQQVIAVRLSRITGQHPDELLDYRRADQILGGRDGR